MANNLIFDHFIPDSKPKLISEELTSGGKKWYSVGIAQKFTENRNGRIYPRSLWEKMLNNLEFQDRMKRKVLLGCLGHPQDGHFEPRHSATAIVEMWIERDYVMVKREIFPTPEGKILMTLIDCGVQLGISSRGYGSEEKNEDGVAVVSDDFVLEGFDDVIDNSVIEAIPVTMKENISKKLVSLVESFNKEDLNAIDTVKILSEKLQPTTSPVQVSKSELGDSILFRENFNINMPNNLENELKEARKQLTEANKQLQESKTQTLLEEKDRKIKEMTERYEASLKLAASLEAKISKTESQLAESNNRFSGLSKKYEAAKAVINDAIEYKEHVDSKLADLEGLEERATKVIASLLREMDQSKTRRLEAYKKNTLKRIPKKMRGSVSALLSEAKSVKSIRKIVEGLDLTSTRRVVRRKKGDKVSLEESSTARLDPLMARIASKNRT